MTNIVGRYLQFRFGYPKKCGMMALWFLIEFPKKYGKIKKLDIFFWKNTNFSNYI
tara:strand:- start:35 stop:199 length:165 start_codon:yes stop_codon:yes gene_type:complete